MYCVDVIENSISVDKRTIQLCCMERWRERGDGGKGMVGS